MMNIKAIHSSYLLFFLVQAIAFGQELKKFTYGGSSGKRHKGTFIVNYYVGNGDRKSRIDTESNTIDLNKYRGNVTFFIELSDLKLGLNKTYDKTRNSDHYRVFYTEVSKLSVKGATPIGRDTVKVSSKTRHYGSTVDGVSFLIQPKTAVKTIIFKIKTRTIDGIYDKQWEGLVITKTITIIPRKQEVLDTISAIAEEPIQRRLYQGNRTIAKENNSLEGKLWSKIEDDLIADNKERALARCNIYRMNCEQGLFEECLYNEEVLFYMLNLVAKEERSVLIEEYNNTYPEGKYSAKVATLAEIPKATVPPIEPGVASIDFDTKAIVLNNIKGGHQPYYVSFYDYKKNKEYAVKRVRFTKENLWVNLESLEIPAGFYAVKVMDAKGQLFTKKIKLYVSEVWTVHNSIKLSILLAFLGSIGLLYKKYIHF